MGTLMNKITESCYDKSGKISHTRISSYFILASILLSNLSFVAIDVTNLILSKGHYEIPMTHIGLYGMTLSHHLFLLGIKKWSENKETPNNQSEPKKEMLL